MEEEKVSCLSILSEETLHQAFEDKSSEAQHLLEDTDKLDVFLNKVECKFREIKGIGKELAKIPLLVQLVRSYIKKEYTDIPLASIVAITAALIYFLSPIDLIPDIIPGIGKVDDAAVLAIAIKVIETDIESYQQWRIENKDYYS